MNKHHLFCGTHVGKSNLSGAGWGVFANDFTRPGEILEECVVMLVSFDKDVLNDYRLAWDDESDAIATGNSELYNYSDTPNVEFVRDFKNTMIRVIAIAPIYRGDELFMKYECGPWW